MQVMILKIAYTIQYTGIYISPTSLASVLFNIGTAN